MKVAIIGATGYGGAELVRILHRHPRVSIHSVHASSSQGEPLSNSFPHMQTIIHDQLQSVDLQKIAAEVDLVFTATPSGVAKELAPALLAEGVKVIDLSGDFRMNDREIYKKWYGIDAADEKLLNNAVYGLTEWIDVDLSEANLIANPGCYPTSVLLGLAPLVMNQKVDENTIIVDAKTGVSGAGKGFSAATHFAETNDNFKIYKVNQHQHTPEIEQMLQVWNSQTCAITFTTHLAPMTRGIMATMYATATEKTSTKELLDLFNESYHDKYFVRIRKEGEFPSTKEVYGSNFCDISLAYDERTNRITIVSVIDNLVKGASGQAVQNMNKMLGIDEKTGIDFMPVFP
ncbi:N-acetyl-gamma-glutamyl-phosphate reductase [Pseudogracilibacillus auburnensis]|uniref:N-acetyl-gamma-glutamyl-phosphate reductase n=1 Tax=Pseudogracilibacillus auburnensis TaxID=1494959 RepID=UPI001A97A168|nr:N-acetyl-gamma-glutamyl-phosphate reductase [Pseudogracilibacillus auburnensis]MBO1002881.1 N-acetyl-gamma-glutamyl-phosphate reductase [Pseudogracilibacillus auburnensis]